MKEFKDCRNPVLPVDLHIPDSEAHVMPDGRVYMYMVRGIKKKISIVAENIE